MVSVSERHDGTYVESRIRKIRTIPNCVPIGPSLKVNTSLHSCGEKKNCLRAVGRGRHNPLLAVWKERKVSQEKLFAMLVSDGSASFEELSWKLESYGIETWSVESRTEAADMMQGSHPELILTATKFPEGTWSEIVDMARKSSVPANVIVVGKRVDIELYVRAIEYGAFDFMLPPFEADQLSHVLRVATADVRRAREAQALLASG